MRELLIYRHGHANDKWGESDFDRELRDKGKRNAQRIGIWLARNNLVPDYVITSPATRARRTAEKTCKTSGLNSSMIQQIDSLYPSDEKELLFQLKQLPDDARRVMLVGHNPALEELLKNISHEPVPKTAKGNILTPAALAWLKLDCQWEQLASACARLVEIVYPKTLPRLFPFPDVGSEETRSRPAYYYRQSSVIPYRITEAGVEILVISSSKNKHWVIPKGIHDPGLTARQSAAKEAYEEAGIEGDVAEDEIGFYRYPKWDAVCEVKVFPMKVEHVLDESDWQEKHRGRHWLSPEDAVLKVKNDDVKRIVGLLPAWLEKNTS